MKIVIDTRWIFPEISGIGSYTTELVCHLAIIDQKNSYTLLFDSPEVHERVMERLRPLQNGNFEACDMDCGVFSPSSQWKLPGLLKKLKADVYHSTNYMIPYMAFPRGKCGKTACVVTIHDLIPLLFPHFTPNAMKTRFFPLFKAIMRETGRRADAILAPSLASKRDIIDCLKTNPDRVFVTPEGVDERYAPTEKTEKPFILYVGRMDPYKNVTGLIKAFATVHAELPDVRLRIIGPDDPRYPEARQIEKDLKLKGAIDWTGYVTGEELLTAYQQAAVMTLPSRYEGFGLPVLEAMACGTPVVCGNASSLPEVAGDAGLLVDPLDEKAIAEALLSILRDPKRAKELREASLKHAATFTWQETARKTLAAYKETQS